MGKIWAAKNQKVLFSFCKDQEKLRAVAAAAGRNARTGTPAEAVAFGELILLSVPWTAVPEALKAAGNFEGKALFSCVNCLKPDFSGLEVGTSTSAAEGDRETCPRRQNGRGYPADGANPGGRLPPPLWAADQCLLLWQRRCC